MWVFIIRRQLKPPSGIYAPCFCVKRDSSVLDADFTPFCSKKRSWTEQRVREPLVPNWSRIWGRRKRSPLHQPLRFSISLAISIAQLTMPAKICSNCDSGKQRRNTYNHFFDGKFCQHCSLACRLAAHGEKREDIPKRNLPLCAHDGCSNWAQRKGKLLTMDRAFVSRI